MFVYLFLVLCIAVHDITSMSDYIITPEWDDENILPLKRVDTVEIYDKYEVSTRPDKKGSKFQKKNFFVYC